MLTLSREAMNTNFLVLGLTRPGIDPKSTVSVADALFTRRQTGLLFVTVLATVVAS